MIENEEIKKIFHLHLDILGKTLAIGSERFSGGVLEMVRTSEP